MPQIGLRASEELIESINDDKGPEESRSEYIRRAIRRQVQSDDLSDRLSEIENRLDTVEEGLNDHGDRIEDLENQGLLDVL